MSLILELINYLMVCQIWSLTAHKKVVTLLFCIMAKPGKIIECSVTKVYKRTRYKRGSSIDRISTLPDDVLVLILSSLPVKEAVATSILSSRWRYLWTFITKLDFDGTSSMVKLIRDKHLSTLRSEFIYLRDYDLRLDKMRLDYVDWVNRVIALHKRPEIEEFRVFFDLTKTYQNTIDEWVRFALTKKVQKLELNLTPEPSSRGLFNNYTLDPYNLLWADKGSFYDSIDHLKYLKKIFLSHVNVNGEALAFFLCNCPLLEHLSISGSDHFSTLKIIGPHPSFKCLEIEFCSSLRSVEIRDLNLVYFKYVGFQAHFVVEKLPLLVEMYFGGMCWNMRDILLPFSSYIAQLEILTLDTVGKPCYDVVREFSSSMKMSNLKQLTIKTRIDYDDSLIHLTELLQASPLLQRFVLEATHHEKSRNVWPLFMSVMGASSYSQLKEIQFVGYEGGPSELELLTHFLDNAVALERLLVDTRKPIKSWQYLCRTYCATCETKLKEIEGHARSRAKKELPIKVPPKVNLKIL